MSAQQPFRSASLDDRLIAEAGAGNTAEVQQLLHEGANLEAKDLYGQTALFWAVQLGRPDTVRLLLE